MTLIYYKIGHQMSTQSTGGWLNFQYLKNKQILKIAIFTIWAGILIRLTTSIRILFPDKCFKNQPYII